MTSFYYMKKMNNFYQCGNYKMAYKYFLLMNQMRLQEGKEFFTMKNLQSKFENK